MVLLMVAHRTPAGLTLQYVLPLLLLLLLPSTHPLLGLPLTSSHALCCCTVSRIAKGFFRGSRLPSNMW
jgi:hypothetical protein